MTKLQGKDTKHLLTLSEEIGTDQKIANPKSIRFLIKNISYIRDLRM